MSNFSGSGTNNSGSDDRIAKPVRSDPELGRAQSMGTQAARSDAVRRFASSPSSVATLDVLMCCLLALTT